MSFGIGDFTPHFQWLDAKRQRVSLRQDCHAGRVTLLLVCPSTAAPAQTAIARLSARHRAFADADVQVFVITARPPVDGATPSATELALFTDPGQATGKALGFAAEGGLAILDECGRIEHLIAACGEPEIDAALAHCQDRDTDAAPGVITRQAPVLIVPNVIDADHCAKLIRVWTEGERYQGGVAHQQAGKHVVKQDVKVREDAALPDTGPEAQALLVLFRRRLFPEIERAFKFRVTRGETLRLGCYAADASGHFKRHRDDTSEHVAHRRFAMSLNLNTGAYQGGQLCFPEFGSALYAPPAGAALVFSCSLLHEATPVTAGRRFVLLGFFHGEAEEAARQARGAPYAYSRVDGKTAQSGPPLDPASMTRLPRWG